MTATTATSSTAAIQLQRIPQQIITIDIKGTTPLIMHAFSEKAKKIMLDAMSGVKTRKEPKNPEQEYLGSLYRFDGEDEAYGMPTVAFKSATVKGGGRTYGKSVKQTELRQALFFVQDGIGVCGTPLTRINGTPIMREDPVRVGMGSADLRYRAMFPDWSATLTVAFTPHIINVESVVALIEAGGMNGVGDWRPEKNGNFGTYEVVA